jgi:phospholipid/cholesterol/gamma-HCH transport system ATP-binding protein
MNSVMTIGEKIVYLRKGIKEWEGTKDILITSDNKYLIDFVYSSELFKELREYLISEAMNSLGIKTTRTLSVVSTWKVLLRVCCRDS